MVPFQIIRSRRRTLCIEISNAGTVLVRAPFWATDQQIRSFVDEKKNWILRQQCKMKDAPMPEIISAEERELLRNYSKKIIPERVRFWSEKTGLSYSAVKITSARKRFGSCNWQNSLCFSLFLARYPILLVDYVVVHELCHTRIRNHSDSFYRLMESILPDYKEREAALREVPIPLVESHSK